MNECKHEAIVKNGRLECLLCGEALSNAKKSVGQADSLVKARSTLDEIASAGEYRAAGTRGNFVVYSRQLNGVTEEITIERTTKRRWNVVKRIYNTT